jgi:CDP-paratose 2-epimerase
MVKKLFVTGSAGRIGSEVCEFFADQNWEGHGVDNNQRVVFFGPQGDNRWIQHRLEKHIPSSVHHEVDIRNLSKKYRSL